MARSRWDDRRWPWILLLLSLVVFAGITSGSTGLTGIGPATVGSIQESQPEADTTVTRIEVAENGSARFAVRIRTRLSNEAETEEYRTFQESFRQNTSTYLDPFRERIAATVGVAENETGREMRATEFRATTTIQEVPRRWGVVTFSFRWENLARTDGENFVVADVFQGGYYLTAQDTLEIQAPPGYTIGGTSPAPDERGNGTVTWRGQRDFENERPRVRFVPETTGGGSTTTTSITTTTSTTTTTTSTSTTPTTTDETDESGVPLGLLAGIALVVILAGGGYVAVLRNRRDGRGTAPQAEGVPDATGASRPGGGETGATGESAEATTGVTEHRSESAGANGEQGASGSSGSGMATPDGSAADGPTAVPNSPGRAGEEAVADDGRAASQGGSADGDAGSEDGWFTSVADPEVLTEEERVLTLLDENGGRIKQGSIAEACDWSPSKTSRVVSDMVEDDVIRKLRIGRENLIERAEDEGDGNE